MNLTVARRQQLQRQLATWTKQRLAKLKAAQAKLQANKPPKGPALVLKPKFAATSQTLDAPWNETAVSHRSVEIPKQTKSRLIDEIRGIAPRSRFLVGEFRQASYQSPTRLTDQQHSHLRELLPPPKLTPVEPKVIPESWRINPLSLSGGKDVLVYRGHSSNVAGKAKTVLRPEDVRGSGTMSRDVGAAHDAVLNAYGRTPVLEGPEAGGVVEVRIPAATWDELVRTNSVSERSYPGFGGGLTSTELRINSHDAARVINNLPNRIIPPDPAFKRKE